MARWYLRKLREHRLELVEARIDRRARRHLWRRERRRGEGGVANRCGRCQLDGGWRRLRAHRLGRHDGGDGRGLGWWRRGIVGLCRRDVRRSATAKLGSDLGDVRTGHDVVDGDGALTIELLELDDELGEAERVDAHVREGKVRVHRRVFVLADDLAARCPHSLGRRIGSHGRAPRGHRHRLDVVLAAGEMGSDDAHDRVAHDVVDGDGALAEDLLELDDELSEAERVEANVKEVGVHVQWRVRAGDLAAGVPHSVERGGHRFLSWCVVLCCLCAAQTAKVESAHRQPVTEG
jgi:hypothetical protein